MENDMSDTVLAIIELDRFPEEVTRRAAWLARLYGCSLQLLLSDPTVGVLRSKLVISNEAKRISEAITAAQEQILEELTMQANGGGNLSIHTSISHERPASDAIIAAAIEVGPRFVVKGTHYHSPAERATFAEVDWQLIRKLDYPLWLVKPDGWDDSPTIVAAVDPTHAHDRTGTLDQRIVDLSKSLAEKTGGELHLLHTYQRLVEIGAYAMFKFKPVKVPVEELDENIKIQHRELLDKLAAANDIAPEFVHQLPGRTQDLLPTFARANGANVVVMGAVSRAGLKQRAVGSTAEQVLDHVPCDILIARSG